MLKILNTFTYLKNKQRIKIYTVKEYQNKIETKFTMVNRSLNDMALCIDV